MFSFSKTILCAVLLAHYAAAAPAVGAGDVATSLTGAASPVANTTTLAGTTTTAAGTTTTAAADAHSRSSTATSSSTAAAETTRYASDDPNGPLWSGDDVPANPQPIRGNLGASIMGPVNVPIAQQNPDLLAPPTTDHGSVQNAKWPYALSHNRMEDGGWARQQNADVMPIAKSMAGVNMRLEAGAIRELHWHKTSEWAYVFKGSVQVTSVDPDGKNFLQTAGPGDLWFFPPGIPHSLQATDDDPDGSEFVLVFDDGAFSEDSTFLLTDWLAHVPKEVLAKNFKTNISAFDHIPAEELYIFNAPVPPSDEDNKVSDPQGEAPNPYVFKLSQQEAKQLDGGSVKIVDSSTFKIATTISAAVVTVEPGAMRELHWHPTQDEWTLYLEGQGRVTLFASSGNARTFNYEAGDVGFVPASFGHYVENTSNTTLRFLEIFNSDRYQDISLNQWLALTPPALVKEHLGLSDDTIAKLQKVKPVVVGPA